jgi:hypothetical protein
MIRRATLSALLLLVALPMRADFDSLVHAVQTIPGLHRVSIPGFGLVRFAVWMVHPKGVHDVQLATFEGRSHADIDRGELERLLRQNADAGYQPLVQQHSRRTGELTLIWARPGRGDTMEVLLLAHDPKDETVVLRAVVDVETIAREIVNPHTAAHIAGR